MKPAVIGIIVAAALIAAFVVGNFVDFDDGEVSLGQDGPAEQVGEAVDDATD